MPLWPSFVPLVQEIVAWCAARPTSAAELAAGEPLEAVVSRAGRRCAAACSSRPTAAVMRSKCAASRRRTQSLTYADTMQSGIYTCGSVSRSDRSAMFAVNVDTAESDLAPIDAGRDCRTTYGRAFRSCIKPRGKTSARRARRSDPRPAAACTSVCSTPCWALLLETFLGWNWDSEMRGREMEGGDGMNALAPTSDIRPLTRPLQWLHCPTWIERLLGISAEAGEGTPGASSMPGAGRLGLTLVFVAGCGRSSWRSSIWREGRRQGRRQYRLMLAGIRLRSDGHRGVADDRPVDAVAETDRSALRGRADRRFAEHDHRRPLRRRSSARRWPSG